jgi:hypothetical protein
MVPELVVLRCAPAFWRVGAARVMLVTRMPILGEVSFIDTARTFLLILYL